MTWLRLVCIRVHGTERAAFFYDIATHHRTAKVKRWLKKHKCDRFEIHANITWKWQLVDVALGVNFFFALSELVTCVIF